MENQRILPHSGHFPRLFFLVLDALYRIPPVSQTGISQPQGHLKNQVFDSASMRENSPEGVSNLTSPCIRLRLPILSRPMIEKPIDSARLTWLTY